MQMPMPPPPFPGASTSPSQGFMDFPALGDADNTSAVAMAANMPMPAPVQVTSTGELKKPAETAGGNATNPMQTLEQMLLPQANEMMQQSLCEKHFPEPIICMGSDGPLCKRCIPEQFEKTRAKMKKKDGKEDNQDDLTLLAQQNLYQSEKSLIQKYLFKLDDFNGDLRFLHDEVDERAQESQDNLENLPELMCQIFAQCNRTMDHHKGSFLEEVNEIIKK